MNKIKHSKKAAPKNWHRADIVCALRKAGWSFRKLSIHHQYASPNTLTKALDRPWPKGERLIAEAIGVRREDIWPERFAANQRPALGTNAAQKHTTVGPARLPTESPHPEVA